MSNDNAIYPLNPADRNPSVDYLGHAVSPEEFALTCCNCNTVVEEGQSICMDCLRTEMMHMEWDAEADAANLKKAS